MIIKYLTYFILLLFIATSCARISSPTGGPEDEEPPALISSVPENGQTNYKGETVLLVFDEIVSTNQIESDLIITPRPGGTFRTRNNRNSVQLTFTEPFADSTTYTFSFAQTIQDVTARNPAENLTLSFSTGDYLDSLSISGQILNLYDQLPAEAITLSLFNANDSVNILNGNAQYYTRTDSSGRYEFKNLPPNQYRVYAFDDKNDNNKADSEGESYGFYPDTIDLQTNASNIDFTIQKLSTKDLRLSSSGQFGKYYELKFNKDITAFEILDNSEYIFHQTNDETIRFYRTTELYNDTTNLIYQAQDSLGNRIQDTTKYYFSESDIETEPFTLGLNPKRQLLKPTQTLRLEFNKPLLSISYDSISYELDSLNRFVFPQDLVKINNNRTVLEWPLTIKDYAPRPDQSLKLIFKAGSFFSIDGDTSQLLQKIYKGAIANETALISGTVNTSEDKLIVQLLNSRNLEVLEEVYTKQFEFAYLDAGAYMIRVIKDTNGNGQWDIGNIISNEPPEPAYFYFDEGFNSQIIEVRKNWAVEGLTINLR